MSKTLKQLKQEYSELLEDLNFNLREQLKVVAGERYSSGKGVVYFINQVGTENYKIGFSRNYDTRKAIFNVKLPFAIEETYVYETENYKELEVALHDYFADNRLNDSEFFHLSANIIASIPNLCRKLETALLEERDREDEENDEDTSSLMVVYERITQVIIEQIEQGVGDFKMPWNRSDQKLPRNILTDNEYQGINTISLWCQATSRHFTSSKWGTYKQLSEAGHQVKKGEKSSIIVFYKELKQKNDDGDDETRRVLRHYSVFNLCQTEDYKPEDVPDRPIDRLEHAEMAVRATGAVIEVGGDRAAYNWATDKIHMPDEGRFNGTDRTEDWYSVLLHELTHWSGHKSRLDREFGKRFGDNAYAVEELVAELGAAYLCARLNITPTVRSDHSAYIQSWLSVLKADKKAIFTASARAQEACNYLL